jgi:hypothetical protein
MIRGATCKFTEARKQCIAPGRRSVRAENEQRSFYSVAMKHFLMMKRMHVCVHDPRCHWSIETSVGRCKTPCSHWAFELTDLGWSKAVEHSSHKMYLSFGLFLYAWPYQRQVSRINLCHTTAVGRRFNQK